MRWHHTPKAVILSGTSGDLWGLATLGITTTFKLCPLTAEGNEHGLNPVTVNRTV